MTTRTPAPSGPCSQEFESSISEDTSPDRTAPPAGISGRGGHPDRAARRRRGPVHRAGRLRRRRGGFFQTSCNKKSMTLDPAKAGAREPHRAAGRDRRRGGRESAGAATSNFRHRLPHLERGASRHHRNDAERLRGPWTARASRRLRRRGTGNVRGDVHIRRSRRTGQGRGAVCGFRNGGTFRLRDPRGPDAPRAHRRGSGGQRHAARHRARRIRLASRRTGGDRHRPRRHRQSGADFRPVRGVRDPRRTRVDARGRQRLVPALGETHGR